MQTSDNDTLLTCSNPRSARPFLRRLRAREALQFSLIIGSCAIALVTCAVVEDQADVQILIPLLLRLAAFGLIVCAMISVSMRVVTPKFHIFKEDSVSIYRGGIFTVQETLAVKKIKTLQVWPVDHGGAQFCLLCMICKHLEKQDYAGFFQRYAGVYPVYFCVESADALRIASWARERHVDIEEMDRLASPADLTLFIK